MVSLHLRNKHKPMANIFPKNSSWKFTKQPWIKYTTNYLVVSTHLKNHYSVWIISPCFGVKKMIEPATKRQLHHNSSPLKIGLFHRERIVFQFHPFFAGELLVSGRVPHDHPTESQTFRGQTKVIHPAYKGSPTTTRTNEDDFPTQTPNNRTPNYLNSYTLW